MCEMRSVIFFEVTSAVTRARRIVYFFLGEYPIKDT